MDYAKLANKFLCTCKGSPCTELLNDPANVLADESRRPSHLCPEVMRWSTRVWALNAKKSKGRDLASRLWQRTWPLPIGRRALEDRIALHDCEDGAQLSNLVPFDGEEEALWAVRVEKEGTVLNLFALAHRTDGEIELGDIVVRNEYDEWRVIGFEKDRANNQDLAIIMSAKAIETMPVNQLKHHREYAPITMGGLRYTLLGQGTMMFEVVRLAERWWASFIGQEIRRGRPQDTGTFESGDHFLRELCTAKQELRAQGNKVTHENVASRLNIDVSTLKRSIKKTGILWRELRSG